MRLMLKPGQAWRTRRLLNRRKGDGDQKERKGIMKVFRVALLQLLPGRTQTENLQIGLAACRKAKKDGADIALFPEMWNCGYHIPADVNRLKGQAISGEGEFVSAFGTLAAELDMAIMVTFLERFEPLREIPQFCSTGTASKL